MRKFGIDIMTANLGDRKSVGRILLPLPKDRAGWHDIVYIDADETPDGAPEDQGQRSNSAQPDPNRTTAKLAWDERGSQKKGTSHVRLDVTLPSDQDEWEAEVYLGMNPEGQPVCRIALPENRLCEIYCHGRMVTIRHADKEKADWDSCSAEFCSRMIYAGLREGCLAIAVTDTEKMRRQRRCPDCCPNNKSRRHRRRR